MAQVIFDSITPFTDNEYLSSWDATQLDLWEDSLNIAYANFVQSGQVLAEAVFTRANSGDSRHVMVAADINDEGGDFPTLVLTNTMNYGVSIPLAIVAKLWASAKATFASRNIVRGRLVLVTGAVFVFVIAPYGATM